VMSASNQGIVAPADGTVQFVNMMFVKLAGLLQPLQLLLQSTLIRSVKADILLLGLVVQWAIWEALTPAIFVDNQSNVAQEDGIVQPANMTFALLVVHQHQLL